VNIAAVADSIDALGNDGNAISRLTGLVMAGNVRGADSARSPLRNLLKFLAPTPVITEKPLGEAVASAELGSTFITKVVPFVEPVRL
jgi:hypothetical protein